MRTLTRDILRGFVVALLVVAFAPKPSLSEDSVSKQIEDLRKEKGNKATNKMSELMQQLEGDQRQAAREVLFERMCRMKSKTLRNKIVANDDLEVRHAAIRAIEKKNKTELVDDLIDLLKDSDLKTRRLSNKALTSLTDHEIAMKIFSDARERARVHSQWTQWWSENRERLESAGGSGGKIDDQNDSGALSSREYASGEGKDRSSNGPEKVLAQKIGRMRLSSGSGKGKNDYFVYYLAQVVPNQGVAEIQFKVIQGQENLADILVRGNDGTNLQQQYTHWQILERHKTQAAADAALQRRRQAYDQFSQYRNRMRQTINVRNTRRC